MYVIAQITLGPDLCIAQAGPNPPRFLTSFIWCTCTRWRGPTVLGFCLCFTYMHFPWNSKPRCCPDQFSTLKMCIPSSWTGLWNNSYGLMRWSLWQQHPLKILLVLSGALTPHCPPPLHPFGWLLTCPYWQSDQRTDSAFANPIKITTSSWFSPCLGGVL